MSIENIPEIKLVKQNTSHHSIFSGKEQYSLLIDYSMDCFIKGRLQIDTETGQRGLLIKINPTFRILPKKFQKEELWKPILAHEIGDFKGSYFKGDHEQGNRYEVAYCKKYLSSRKIKKHLELATILLGEDHPKVDFLGRSFNQ